MLYEFLSLVTMILLSVTIISSIAIAMASAESIMGSKTFDLRIDNQKYPLRYNITGGKVSGITADSAQSTLLINIASTDDGTLTIELPRNLIDSKAQGNIDDQYAVFIDDQPKQDFDEIINNNQVRVLKIGFENGAQKIEIAGTHIVPEFGSIAVIIFAISIIGLMITATKYKKFNFIPKH